jgi:xanthine dehydrogenase YagR molybdenum-binding subunit
LPTLARSQVEGGIIQGLGYALYENRQLDLVTGFNLASNLEDYHIPGIGDIPPLRVTFFEEGFEQVRGRGIGIAELATVGVAASVGNAVFDATGWRPRKTPVTPHAVLEGVNP